MKNTLKIKKNEVDKIVGKSICIYFPAHIVRAANMVHGDIISYSLTGDLLNLELKGQQMIGRGTPNSRFRTRAICITPSRFADIFKYNIPAVRTEIPFNIINDKIVIDLSIFKVKSGFSALKDTIDDKPSKVISVQKVKNFSELSKFIQDKK